jgi:hypothetical protein
MATQRYTAAQVIAALVSTNGLTFLAAKRLKCDPETIRNYCKRYPSVQAARDAQRGQMIDLAEQKLLESIQRGEAWGISLCLKTLGRDRGYVERQEHTGADGVPLWEVTAGLAALLDAARQALTSPEASVPTNGHRPPGLLPRYEDG